MIYPDIAKLLPRSQGIHKTANFSASKTIPIIETVDIINRKMLIPNDVKLYIGDEKSLLHPLLPVYNWN